MENHNLSNSGIEVIGDVKWGTHFCQFYLTKKDLLDILVPYFKSGLENNELCVWVTSEFLDTDEAVKALKKGIPKFSKYLKKGLIEIFPYTEWYLKGGQFEMKRVLKDWVIKHDYALKKGFNGLRVSGNPFWLDNKKDWNDFAEYEAEINNVIDKYKLIVLCTYSLAKCVSDEIIDVVSNHEFALVKRKGKWENIESAGHKKMEEALRISEKRYRTLMDDMLEGCQILNTDWRYLYVNDSAVRQSHLTKDKLLNNKIMDLYPGIEKTEMFAHLKVCMEKRVPKRMENMFIYPDGSQGWFELIIEPIYDGIFILSLDITERKKAEEKIKKLDQQKDEFISTATHELKTPLTSIKAYSQIALESLRMGNSQTTLEVLKRLENQTDKISNLVGELLDSSRIQSGRLILNKESFNLTALVKEVIDDMVVITKADHKQFDIKFRGQPNIEIFGDKFRLSQVLVNLLTNAIKYSPNSKDIFVKIKKRLNEVEVSVQDFGIGISEDQQPYVFDRFYQGEVQNDRNSKFTSLGLGLYIVSNIIRQHGGRIWVESERGKGSIFYFTIPIN